MNSEIEMEIYNFKFRDRLKDLRSPKNDKRIVRGEIVNLQCIWCEYRSSPWSSGLWGST